MLALLFCSARDMPSSFSLLPCVAPQLVTTQTTCHAPVIRIFIHADCIETNDQAEQFARFGERGEFLPAGLQSIP